eukprot:701951_1
MADLRCENESQSHTILYLRRAVSEVCARLEAVGEKLEARAAVAGAPEELPSSPRSRRDGEGFDKRSEPPTSDSSELTNDTEPTQSGSQLKSESRPQSGVTCCLESNTERKHSEDSSQLICLEESEISMSSEISQISDISDPSSFSAAESGTLPSSLLESATWPSAPNSAEPSSSSQSSTDNSSLRDEVSDLRELLEAERRSHSQTLARLQWRDVWRERTAGSDEPTSLELLRDKWQQLSEENDDLWKQVIETATTSTMVPPSLHARIMSPKASRAVTLPTSSSPPTPATPPSTPTLPLGHVVVSQSGQVVSQSGQVDSQSGQVVTQSGQVVSQSNEVVNQSAEMTVEPGHVLSQSENELDQVDNLSQEMCSQPGQVVSQPSQLVDQFDDVMSQPAHSPINGDQVASLKLRLEEANRVSAQFWRLAQINLQNFSDLKHNLGAVEAEKSLKTVILPPHELPEVSESSVVNQVQDNIIEIS